MSSFHKSDATLWCPRPPSFFRLGDAWGEGGLFRQNATADTLLMPVLLLSPGVLPLTAAAAAAPRCEPWSSRSLCEKRGVKPAPASRCFFSTSLILHNAAECRLNMFYISPQKSFVDFVRRINRLGRLISGAFPFSKCAVS